MINRREKTPKTTLNSDIHGKKALYVVNIRNNLISSPQINGQIFSRLPAKANRKTVYKVVVQMQYAQKIKEHFYFIHLTALSFSNYHLLRFLKLSIS